MDYNNEIEDNDIKNSSKSLDDKKKKTEVFYSMYSNVSDNSLISSNFENNYFLMNPEDFIYENEKNINDNSCVFVSLDERIINYKDDYEPNNNINSINYISYDNNNNLINNKDNEYYNYDINDTSNYNNNSYEDNYFNNEKFYNINK